MSVLEQEVRRIVREELAAALGGVESDPWLDSKEAASYIGVGIQRVHDLVTAGVLPRHGNKGERLRFRRSELDSYMRGGTAQTARPVTTRG